MCSLFLKTLLRICTCLLVPRTSAAGHPLHQAVSCHFLSFHFIVSSVFSSFLFYDHCVCFIPLKNSCFALFFILKESFPSVFFLKKFLLVYSLLVRSPLVVLPFFELFPISTSVFHLFFERIFQNLPLLLCDFFSVLFFHLFSLFLFRLNYFTFFSMFVSPFLFVFLLFTTKKTFSVPFLLFFFVFC